MSFRNCLTSPLLVACFITSALAQDKQLSDAKTYADVAAYVQQEMGKHKPDDHDAKENARVFAGIFFPASDKLLGIAQNDTERQRAYNMKLTAFQHQIAAKMEGAEQSFEAFLNELASHDNADFRNLAVGVRLNQFTQKINSTAPSLGNYNKLRDELKMWINQGSQPASRLVSLGLQIAERNRIAAEQFVREITVFVQSSECTLPEEEKKALMAALEGIFRLTAGKDPNLYGKTLDNEDFDWEKLRGKHVLIKFTATWCGPCQREIPGMLEAYEKYHDKGLEIVSVYMWQREADPVATVKKYVEEKELPWIVISEELSKKAGYPEFGTFYGVRGVPTMVLVNKTGKIIMTEARGSSLKNRLGIIFR